MTSAKVGMLPDHRKPSSVGGTFSPAPTLGFTRDMVVAVVGTVAIGIHLTLRYLVHSVRWIEVAPLFLALLFGVPLLVALGKNLWVRNFGSDLLAGISIVAAIAMLRQ